MRPLPCVSMWASHTLLLSSSLTYTCGTGFERESRAVVLPVGTKLTWNHFAIFIPLITAGQPWKGNMVAILGDKGFSQGVTSPTVTASPEEGLRTCT